MCDQRPNHDCAAGAIASVSLDPMNNSRRFTAITNAFLTIRRENVKTLARLKALETVVSESVPEDQREEWYKRVDKWTSRIQQDLLESLERESPEFAAILDDRSDEELRDIV